MTERVPLSFGRPRRLGRGCHAVQTHEALHPVQAAAQTLGQHIVPDPASPISAVTVLEAPADRLSQLFIYDRMGAGQPAQPGMEA